MQKRYCVKCKKEVSENTKQCECGNRDSLYGEGINLVGEKIICKCGSSEFKFVMHMDCQDKYINNYACTKCGNTIGTENYRTGEDMMYWED